MRKILIVDDDENIRVIFKKVLENAGYDVDTASNGLVALEILENKQFDIYLLDLKMPEMDGLTLLEEIKKRGHEGIPIILTAYGDKESAITALKLGAYDFVEKPVSINDMRFAIQRALEKKILLEENVKLKEVEKLHKAVVEMLKSDSEEEFLKNFPRILIDSLNFESAMLYIYSPEEKTFFYPKFIPEIENYIQDARKSEFSIKDTYMLHKISPSEEIEGIMIVKSFFPFIDREIETFKLICKQGEILWKELVSKRKLEEALEKLKAYHLTALRTGRVSVLGEISNTLIKEIENPLNNVEMGLSYFFNREDLVDLKETKGLQKQWEELKKVFNNFKEIMSSIKPTRKKVKLGEVINMCYEILLPQFVESRVSFWRGGVEDVEIDGYPGLIEQIFINLFINSLDIMKEGGRIEVRIDEEEDLVRVEVRDTGPGIPADIKNRIFEPFFTTKKEGTGMGLTLVKHGVEMHGGKIDLESEEGVGTAFYITLPKRWEGY